MPSLGVIVYGLAGMEHLPRCLDSVQWADAVSVHSLDHESETGPSLGKVPTDWVLHLWGDERVEEELAEELKLICRKELARGPLAYRVPIRSHLLGRRVKGSLWGPTPSLRLARGIMGFPSHWWDSKLKVAGEKTGLLRGWISDYSCSELQCGLDRVNAVSSLWAQRFCSDGRSLSHGLIATYPVQVLMSLLFKEGLLFRGMAGLSLSALAAYSTLASGMKWYEAHRAGTK